MAAAWESYSVTSAGTSLSPSAPSGLVSSDLQIAIAFGTQSGDTAPAPAGWSLVGSIIAAGFAGTGIQVWSASGSTAAGTWSFVGSTILEIHRISGAASVRSSAFREATTWGEDIGNGNMPSPSAAVVAGDAVLSAYFGPQATDAFGVPASGYTRASSRTSPASQGTMYRSNVPTTGATGELAHDIGQFYQARAAVTVVLEDGGSPGGGSAAGGLAPITLTPAQANASTTFDWPEPVAVGWIRVRPGSGNEVWYNVPGRAILEHYYFGAAPAGESSATGSLAPINLTPAQGAAAGGGAATGALAPVNLAPAQAVAAGGATATGALATVTLTPAQANASTGAAASGALASINLTPAQAAATGAGVASGALAAVTLTPAQANASTGAAASGALASINLTPAQAIATGAGVASGALAPVTLTPAQASAGVGAAAVGAMASISLTPAQAAASGGAVAAGPMVGINLTPAQAAAAGGAWVQAELAQIFLTAAQATISEGFVPEYTDLPAGSGHTRGLAAAARPAVQGPAQRPAHAAANRPARP